MRMATLQSASWASRLNMVLLVTGAALLLVGICFDWTDLFARIGLPAGELSNRWLLADLATLRVVCIVLAAALVFSRIVLWRAPDAVASLSRTVDAIRPAAAESPLVMALALTVLVLAKTVLQLGLYLLGYRAYA